MSAKAALFSLLRMEICGGSVDEQWNTALSGDMLTQVFSLAAQHDLAHIAGNALSKLGLLDEDAVSGKFRQVSLQAVRRYVQMNHDFGQLCCALEAAHIPFLPLKGAVIRDYYPEPWMRTSGDVDILIREEDLPQAIELLVSSLGYRNNGRGYYDVSLLSPNHVHVELHFSLLGNTRFPAARDILAPLWEQVFPVQDGHVQMQMPDELFYFYHILHMANHFYGGGSGIRSFLDLWILNHKVAHDVQKREALLQKGGLLTFAQAAQQLSEVWFSGQAHTGLTQQLEEFTLRGGVYGNAENMAAVQQAEKGGKLQPIVRKIILPYSVLKGHYPILKKHKWLLPFCQVARWFRLFSLARRKRSIHELKARMSVSKATCASAEQLLKQLGL